MDAFAVIVLFYLVLLLKWELVVRPILYWIGMLAIVATMFFGLFLIGTRSEGVATAHLILTLLTTLAALACAVGAVYRGKLPDAVQKAVDQVTQQPK